MFKKAERVLVNPTIALMGPTGSGKTYSALRLATGIANAMNGRIALIDTENGSASLYSDKFDFDTLNIRPPFTTEKYIEAINAAEKAGYCVLVIDSMTHAWAGEGGLLEQKAQLDSRPNSNHWTNWNPIKAKDQKFKSAYLHSTVPFVLGTMRSKMEYAQSENNGKKKIEKMGMAPVQTDGIEYEFSIVFDIAMNNEAEVSKDRSGIFANQKIFQITEETGAQLVAWRNSGKPMASVEKKPETPPAPPQGFEPHGGDEEWPNFESQSSVDVLGDYRITIGKKHKGKRLSEIPIDELIGYVEWLEGNAEQKGIKLEGDALAFRNAATKYLAAVGA